MRLPSTRRRNIVRESPGVSSSIVICLTIGPPRKSVTGSPITRTSVYAPLAAETCGEQAPEPINCAGGVKRRRREAANKRVALRSGIQGPPTPAMKEHSGAPNSDALNRRLPNYTSQPRCLMARPTGLQAFFT